MINFVTFFVDPGPEKLDSYYAALHRANLSVMAESVHLNVPQSRVILLTDCGTIVPDNLGQDRVYRCHDIIDYSNLMTFRVRAQFKYLSSPIFDADTVFLDTDIIVQHDPSEMFRSEYDIGLSYRHNHEYHYQAGLVLVPKPRARGSVKLKRFFEWWLHATWEILETTKVEDSLASQAALSSLVLMSDEGLFMLRDWLFYIFPCDKYHSWPKWKKGWNGALMEGVPFVHFKGERKTYMAEYWEKCNASLANVGTNAS